MQCNTMEMVEQVRTTIRQHNLFSPGESVLVGVSGGADSVCLLHILHRLRGELGISVYGAHIHHGIRGEEADRDAEFVRNLCKEWKIPFSLRKIEVPAFAEREKLSEETAGRVLRYRCFREICETKGIDKIATAHHQNDQAETVLMRIFRGAGVDGLAGIRYCRQDGVVRPLLDISRKKIESYCQENNLTYCTDSTNTESEYARNRIRNQLIPEIEEHFNPNIVATLSNLAKNMAADGAFLNGYASRLYRRLGSPLPARRPVVLETESLQLVEPAIQLRLFKLAAEDTMGKGYKAERKHWEAIQGLLKKETGTKVDLPGGLIVSAEYGWLTFRAPEMPPLVLSEALAVEPGGTYSVPDGKICLTLAEPNIELADNQWMLDFDKISDKKLELRTRKNGDRIAVYQDGKKRKLKNFLIDQKIPKEERDRLVLLCSGNEVLAVPPYRVAEPYKVNRNTEKGLVVTYDKDNESR